MNKKDQNYPSKCLTCGRAQKCFIHSAETHLVLYLLKLRLKQGALPFIRMCSLKFSPQEICEP